MLQNHTKSPAAARPRPAAIQPLEARRLMSAYAFAEPAMPSLAELGQPSTTAMPGPMHGFDGAVWDGGSRASAFNGMAGPAGGFGLYAMPSATATSVSADRVTASIATASAAVPASLSTAAPLGPAEFGAAFTAAQVSIPVAQTILDNTDAVGTATVAFNLVGGPSATASPQRPTLFAITADESTPWTVATPGAGLDPADGIIVSDDAPFASTDPNFVSPDPMPFAADASAPASNVAVALTAGVAPAAPAPAVAAPSPAPELVIAAPTVTTAAPSFGATLIGSAGESRPLAMALAAGAATALWVSTESARDRRRDQAARAATTAAADPADAGRFIALGLFRG